MLNLIKILSLLLCIGCASKESIRNETPEQTDNPANPDPINPTLNSLLHYGYIGKCLTNVTKAGEMEFYIKLKYELKCSPVFSGKDKEEVTVKLVEWSNKNCPESLPIAGEENCDFFAYKPVQVISTDNSINKEEHCKAQVGKNYGSLIDHKSIRCNKQIGLF